jgi:hypothetical protein
MVMVVGTDQSVVRRVICKNCASVLEYTRSEIIDIKHGYDYTGGYEVDSGIVCPSCRANVFVRR